MKSAPVALSIAGSDTCGGAGIQADIKVFEEFKVYGTCVIAGLTAQNTRQVKGFLKIPKYFFSLQIETLLSDIVPAAFKTGMIGEAFMPKTLAFFIKKYRLKNFVLDPVIVSKSGACLCSEKTRRESEKYLYPLSDIITPNIPEAEIISKVKIRTEEDIFSACEKISQKGPKSVLLKGGHGKESVLRDYYWEKGNIKIYSRKRINTKNTHGTGCSLSAAITALLAIGLEKEEAVKRALEYAEGAIKNSFGLGRGWGPLNHFFYR